jgi:hypothetical protein
MSFTVKELFDYPAIYPSCSQLCNRKQMLLAVSRQNREKVYAIESKAVT